MKPKHAQNTSASGHLKRCNKCDPWSPKQNISHVMSGGDEVMIDCILVGIGTSQRTWLVKIKRDEKDTIMASEPNPLTYPPSQK